MNRNRYTVYKRDYMQAHNQDQFWGGGGTPQMLTF